MTEPKLKVETNIAVKAAHMGADIMPKHLSRNRLARSIAGAFWAMILSATALFTAAHHWAG